MSRLLNRTSASISVADWRKLQREVRRVRQGFVREDIEEIILASGQLVVPIPDIPADLSTYYVCGINGQPGRLSESQYTVDSEDQITLTQSYPEGSILRVEYLAKA